MNQSFRIAIKLEGQEAMHFVIRDLRDLDTMFAVITGYLHQHDNIEYIKWVPIPDLGEV